MLCLAVCAALQLADVDMFEEFKARYNRSYASAAEEATRRANFAQTLALIAERNLRGDLGRHAINAFADLSQAEFRQRFLSGYRRSSAAAGRAPPPPPHANRTSLAALRAGSVDWRTHSPPVVSKVKNQGSCGSCWAFSATEQIESDAALSSGTAVLELSPQQITSCDTHDGGCNGGDPATAFEYVAAAGGIDSEQSYPYTAQSGNCRFTRDGVKVTISGAKRVGGEEGMLAQMQNSPMSVCVDASSWSSYGGGVVGAGCGQSIDHCVQAVGFNNGYWIVRNSWGTGWGEGGFIYVREGINACGIGSEPRVVTGAKPIGPAPPSPPTPPPPGPTPPPPPGPPFPTPPPPAPGGPYGNPFAGPCAAGETNVTMQGSAVCAPACPKGSCLPDVPSGVEAMPQCMFEGKHCALMCTADAMCGPVGTCKPFMGLGACMYDNAALPSTPAQIMLAAAA